LDEVNATLKRASLDFSADVRAAAPLVRQIHIPALRLFATPHVLQILRATFPHVEQISIEEAEDDQVPLFQQWPHLKTLILCDTGATLRGETFNSLPRSLETLIILRGRLLTYNALQRLSHLDSLQTLYIGDLGASLEGAEKEELGKEGRFRTLPASLTELHLIQTDYVVDDDLIDFSRLERLERLNISATNIHGMTLDRLPHSVGHLFCRACISFEALAAQKLRGLPIKELDVAFVENVAPVRFKKIIPTAQRVFHTAALE